MGVASIASAGLFICVRTSVHVKIFPVEIEQHSGEIMALFRSESTNQVDLKIIKMLLPRSDLLNLLRVCYEGVVKSLNANKVE